MDLQDEVINELGRQMSAEIDFQILADVLCDMGWTKIVLTPMTIEQSAEIDSWTATQVKGSFKNMGLVWIFEYEADANWFALRWL